MMVNYLYIEDSKEKRIEDFAKQLETNGLKIEIYSLDTADASEDKFTSLTQKIKNFIEGNELPGILIDYRLDDTRSVDFRASTPAQWVRENFSRLKKDIPIVLISTDEKIKNLFYKETTGYDLFDRYIKKDDLVEREMATDQSRKLISLAKGYVEIKKVLKSSSSGLKILKMILKYEKIEETMDIEAYGYFISNPKVAPHEYASFILKELFGFAGYLINEEILAARLGVDIDSSPDWPKLRDKIFKKAKYEGVFNVGWNRWWMAEVHNIFEKLTGEYLIELKAEERVEKLKTKTKLKGLNPAKPIEDNESTYFWTICKKLKKPLDSLEGFKAKMLRTPKPWQEYDYYSFRALIDFGVKKRREKLHPSEYDRFKEMVRRRKKDGKNK